MRASTRHQLKHDRFAETVAESAAGTWSWASANRAQVIVGSVVIAAVLAASIGYYVWNQSQRDKANIAYAHALRVYETPLRPPGTPATPGFDSFSSLSERSQAARREFADIWNKYPHTTAGKLAQYFIGITYKDEGNYPEADKALQISADSGDSDVAALAHYALASIYGATNRTADAIKQYKDIIDRPAGTVTKPTAQLELAQLYQDHNQPQDAVRLLEQIKSENANTPVADEAQQRLAVLNKGTANTPAPSPLAR